MESSPTDPFGHDPITEVYLPEAPLARVLSQVRWPAVTELKADLDGVATRLGQQLSETFPLYGQQREAQVLLTPEGVTQTPGAVIYQFQSVDENWKVSMTDSFLTLETSVYRSRTDFCNRLASVLASLASVINPPWINRVGFRYVNRVEGQNFDLLDSIVEPAVLGGAAVPLSDGVSLVNSISQTVYALNDAMLLARWAKLPAGNTIDPSIEAVDGWSWVLDLDAYREGKMPFDATGLSETAASLSAIAYNFFRWATKPEFLRLYGGEIDAAS